MSDGMDAGLGPGWVSAGVRELADLPPHLQRLLDELPEERGGNGGVAVATASEIMRPGSGVLPDWIGTDTFHLVIADVPLPAVMRLPTLLGLHKPDRRLHLTRDPGVLRRLIVASRRDVAAEGILDAYVVGDELVLVLGDLTVRSFPRSRVPGLADARERDVREFEIDDDGSYLRWTAFDLDLSVPSILQAVDPMYLADIEIDRIAREDTGTALREMREERGLRQKDVSGMTERQVRRLEKGTSRLTAEAARRFADSFELPLDAFLEVLGRRVRERAEEVEEAV